MTDSLPDTAASEPEWGRTARDVITADLDGALDFRCMGCGVRVGEDHEQDCEEIADVTGH